MLGKQVDLEAELEGVHNEVAGLMEQLEGSKQQVKPRLLSQLRMPNTTFNNQCHTRILCTCM